MLWGTRMCKQICSFSRHLIALFEFLSCNCSRLFLTQAQLQYWKLLVKVVVLDEGVGNMGDQGRYSHYNSFRPGLAIAQEFTVF